jgi:hypothetical protein
MTQSLKQAGQNVTRGGLLAADPFEFSQLTEERTGGFRRSNCQTGRSLVRSVWRFSPRSCSLSGTHCALPEIGSRRVDEFRRLRQGRRAMERIAQSSLIERRRSAPEFGPHRRRSRQRAAAPIGIRTPSPFGALFRQAPQNALRNALIASPIPSP